MFMFMNGEPDASKLDRRIAVLEERMNTHQATYATALERMERRMAERDTRLTENMAKRDAEMAKRDAEMAKRDTEMAKRETRMLLSIAAMIGLGITILGLILNLMLA